MRVVPRYKALNRTLPRRLRWTRARVPTRRRIPRLYRPENREIVRPSARVSLMQLAATLAVALVIWSIGAIFQTVYADRIYPHVTIDHVPVGGMTRAEALTALRDTEAARISAPIFVRADEKSWQVTPAQFGAHYDITSAVDRALAMAHTGPLFFGGWNEAVTIFNGANVALSGTHDRVAVARFLAQAAREIHVAPRGAVVGVRGNDVAILREPIPGRQLDGARAPATLGAAINTHDATSIALPLQQVDSALGHNQAEDALARARNLLSAPIQILYSDPGNNSAAPWYLDKRGMLRLLTFTPRCGAGSCHFELGINTHKLAEAFDRGGVSTKVDRPPIPASFGLYHPDASPADAQVRIFRDFPGSTINVGLAANEILQQANQAPPRTVYLPMLSVSTFFTQAVASALNLDNRPPVGYWSVDYGGLDWARLDNLTTAANAITNTIVQPGHTFDLSTIAGPLSATEGYTTGENIVNPGDITGVNGGASLVGSAVLGAAYDAGLQIDRRVHYPYLSLYAPPGLDTMVTYDAGRQGHGKGSAHAPDLVFRNTTDHPMLVMAESATTGGGADHTTVYIFNGDGYAPMHQRGTYNITVDNPQVTLNQDGSVDATISRTITIDGKVTTTTHDSISSHATPIDP